MRTISLENILKLLTSWASSLQHALHQHRRRQRSSCGRGPSSRSKHENHFYLLAQTRLISLLTIVSQAALLQEEHSQGRLAPSTSIDLHAEAAANTLLLKDTATGKIATVQLNSQDDPFILGWASLGAFHIVECSGVFTTVAAASAHLATGTTSSQGDDEGAGGAFKLLIATASADALRF